MWWAAMRPCLLRQAAGDTFDVLVVGGGVTGAAVAREAALAGLRVALVEAGDFAGGTSSRSTKIFHGGLRYLRNGEFGLVRDAGRERERMAALAPHLVRRVPMVLPVYRGGRYGPGTLSAAVWLYDALAAVPRKERRRFLSAEALLRREPSARAQGLLGGVLYHEYVTDDARATLTVLQAAIDRGAVALNYCPAVAVASDGGRAVGVVVRDALEAAAGEFRIAGRLVVAAAGSWAEAVARLDGAARGAAPALACSRGSHIVVAHERLPVSDAWSVPTADGRLVFIIPRGDATYIGTTDEAYEGDPRHPPVPEADVGYLLAAANAQFPTARLGAADIVGQWAGVRPLVRQPGRSQGDTSRRDRIWVSESGVVGIAGGKLTGWRHMGEEVLRVLRTQWRRRGPAEGWPPWPGSWEAYLRSSRGSPLPGAPHAAVAGAADFADYAAAEGARLARDLPVDPAVARELVGRYGAEAADLAASASALPEAVPLWDAVADGLPLIGVELARFLTRDRAVRLADVVVRRTGLGWFGGRAAVAALPAMAASMGAVLGWSAEQVREEMRDCLHEAYWLERDLYRAEAERMGML